VFKDNILKKRLAAGENLSGAWIETGSATNVEVLGHLGFDYLLIDLEHGQGDVNDLVAMLRAAQVTGTPAVVRVPWNDPVYLKRVLDAGADSLMIPMIENAAEASAAVRACRYPPQGSRGYAAPAVRASNYGAFRDYMSRANDNLLLILQIETEAAVREAAAIAAVDGVDVVFLGVNDMAGSIGLLEQLDHADARALVREAETALKGTGAILGTVPSAGASWQSLFQSGYQFVPVASDVGLLRDAALACVAEQRQFKTQGNVATAAQKQAKAGY
jgi:4-hydroxy-2-oxoheptanedioate aldolase